MNPTSRPKVLMATLAVGILALGAFAVGVEAKPGDGQGNQSQDPAANQDARYHQMCDHPANATVQKRCDEYARMKAQQEKVKQDRHNVTADRKAMRQDRKELRDDIKDFCDKAAANSTAAQRCAHLKDAVKARRVAAELLTAIRVHERELGRIDYRIEMVKEHLQNATLNATAKADLESRLSHLETRHDGLVQKIKDEQAKLASLRDRWTEVKDHLKDREDKGQDDGGVPADGSAPASGSSSTSAAA